MNVQYLEYYNMAVVEYSHVCLHLKAERPSATQTALMLLLTLLVVHGHRCSDSICWVRVSPCDCVIENVAKWVSLFSYINRAPMLCQLLVITCS